MYACNLFLSNCQFMPNLAQFLKKCLYSIQCLISDNRWFPRNILFCMQRKSIKFRLRFTSCVPPNIIFFVAKTQQIYLLKRIKNIIKGPI
jgi:hypothetical protein